MQEPVAPEKELKGKKKKEMPLVTAGKITLLMFYPDSHAGIASCCYKEWSLNLTLMKEKEVNRPFTQQSRDFFELF